MAALWRQLDELHAGLLPAYFRVAPRTPEEWDRTLAAPYAAVMVAEEASQVVGAVTVRVYETPPDPRMVPSLRGHVDGVAVAEGHRRQGIGRALMAAAADWARQRGAVRLVLTVWAGNAAARAFYESLGYGQLSEVLDRPL